jgi:phosphoglycerate dehydrogenase-like enzyme
MIHILLDVVVTPEAAEQLRRLPNVELRQLEGSQKSIPRPAELLQPADILICKRPPENFGELASLKLLQLATVGYEHLAHLKLGERPFVVCNARGVFDTAIAEWNAAMMINLARDLRGMIRQQEQGAWHRADRFQQEIRGKTIGFWGYGGLGRETARVAKALGMIVHVLTRSGINPRHSDFTPPGTGDPEGKLPDKVYRQGQEREFLADLDFLILALPHTEKTTGLIGENELRALPRRAFVLNPARGPIIQEQALLQALREGWIAGAALDTHYRYPMPPDHPLWQFPNVIMTPHVSGGDHSSLFSVRMGQLAIENLKRFVEGLPLLNVVSRDDLREASVPQKFW